MAGKPDPFDVKALESAVNDSATRVSAIWITFLIFSLYLLIAAGTVTQRQLFLDEPTKLPVLNIDLPLWWFFLLAPILFVVLHIYVLLQVLLLGRTAAAYNNAISRLKLLSEENNSLRQRLANTLFAQIFAGSPRERGGVIGWQLKSMAWITLAAAPPLIVVAFQFRFLLYHSHVVTWTHRVLILIELLAFFLIWPLALDAQKDFRWPIIGATLKRLIITPRNLLLGPKKRRHEGWLWLREHALPLFACIFFVLVPLSLATFPGEPHVNLFTGQPLISVQCTRWFSDEFDRLIVPRVSICEGDKLSTIEQIVVNSIKLPSIGHPIRSFRDRDFNCPDHTSTDLRRGDFTEAHMTGATLDKVNLEGASLEGAELQGASLNEARLQRASLNDAHLQGAWLYGAQLQGASFERAELQGAYLVHAHLQGALFGSGAAFAELALEQPRITTLTARLQSVSAQLQGADLSFAELQGASLDFAELQGASLDFVQLQGIIRNWISTDPAQRDYSAQLAHGLLGEDGRECDVTKDLDEETKNKLRTAAKSTQASTTSRPRPPPAIVPSTPSDVAPPAPPMAPQVTKDH